MVQLCDYSNKLYREKILNGEKIVKKEEGRKGRR